MAKKLHTTTILTNTGSLSLFFDECNVWLHVLKALGRVGQGNQEVITALLDFFKDLSVSSGSRSFNFIFDKRKVWWYVLETLGRVGQDNKEVIAVLLKLLKELGESDRLRSLFSYPRNDVWQGVLDTLGKVGQGNQEVIAALLESFKSVSIPSSVGSLCLNSESDVWQGIIDALGKVGQGNKNVIVALLQLLNDLMKRLIAIPSIKLFAESKLWWSVLDALGKVGQGNQEIIVTLSELFKDLSTRSSLRLRYLYEKSEPRWFVLSALSKVGQCNEQIQLMVLEQCSGDDRCRLVSIRRAAVKGLGGLARYSEAVLSQLLELLEDKDSYIQQTARESLIRLGQTDRRVVLELLMRFKYMNSSVRQQIVLVLGHIGQDYEQVLSDLLKLLKDEDSDIQKSAAKALSSIYTFSKDSLVEQFKIWQKQQNELLQNEIKTENNMPLKVRRSRSQADYSSPRQTTPISATGSPSTPRLMGRTSSATSIYSLLVLTPQDALWPLCYPAQFSHSDLLEEDTQQINSATRKAIRKQFSQFWTERCYMPPTNMQTITGADQDQLHPPYRGPRTPRLKVQDGNHRQLEPAGYSTEGTWVVALVRQTSEKEGDASPLNKQHTFLILEAIRGGYYCIYRIDFGVDITSQNLVRKLGMIIKGPAKITVSEKSEIYLKELLLHCVYEPWCINVPNGEKLLKTIREDQGRKIGYVVLGDTSGLISSAQGEEEEHNCFTYCIRLLEKILTSEEIKNVAPNKWTDKIAVVPSLHLPAETSQTERTSFVRIFSR